MEQLSMTPAPWHRLKLTLWGIVFQDQFGNFVMVDPHRQRPLGMAARMKRPPTIYVAMSDAELETALEEMLWLYERSCPVNTRHLDLVERVQAARERQPASKASRKERLPKVA